MSTISRSRAPRATSTCYESLYVFKGTPSVNGAPGRARPGRSRVQGRGSQPGGIASWSRGEPPRPGGREQGGRAHSGRQPAAPYGRKPTGRGAAAGRLPPLFAGGRYRLQRAHGDRASASWPGSRSAARRGGRRENVTGRGPELRALSGAAPRQRKHSMWLLPSNRRSIIRGAAGTRQGRAHGRVPSGRPLTEPGRESPGPRIAPIGLRGEAGEAGPHRCHAT